MAPCFSFPTAMEDVSSIPAVEGLSSRPPKPYFAGVALDLFLQHDARFSPYWPFQP